ncbi:FAD-binding protein [Amycolatopsis sp. K13G38]|uniref:FAD-binding protein n=1 Tax=Amycolatopsis acididurans TaxID=2724524 RepID=A0ABX1J502_9PSEU|nr:FAD-dependent oxidoreductase [Amycolatopsis acididurans]NKQ54694.1 FAD-binding protein [Amycolatopsis acididurans]
MKDNVDLLVVGGGMAGLTAAARAARHGLDVLLVDSAPNLGGSALYAGYLWTAPTIEAMDEANPHGDPALNAALVDGFGGAVDFLRGLEVPCGPAVPILRFGRGHQFDTALYVDTCRKIVQEGGTVLMSTTTEKLVVDAGVVTGAELTLPGGESRTVTARATLLATGGFQADAGLRAELVHDSAREIPLRSNPFSRGDGLRLAQGAGGAAVNERGGFYGHLVPAHVPLEPDVFVDLALYYSEHALLFNLAGERFIDETVGDHLNAMALLDQPEARGLLVTDARGYREFVTGAYVEGAPATDKFALAWRRGGRCVIADDAEDFAAMPPEWGYDGARIAEQVARLARGEAAGPAREFDPRPLDELPYYVVETVPAITFPFAGVRIDPRGRVLSATAKVVPGLYAAGSDIGGLYVGAYAGGLAPAVVFALAGADDIAATLK